MSVPSDAPVIEKAAIQEPVAPPAPAPAVNNGPIHDADVDHWKNSFNAVLSRPGEHINSKSPETSTSWTAGFFDCFNPIDLCLITCCVPCVTFGKVHHRVHKNGDLEGWEPINTSCLLFCGSGCFGLQWIPASMQRAAIRQKYNLQGGCIEDLAKSFCCGCCSLIQADKEAEHGERLLKEASQQQYKPAEGMVYPGAA